MAQKDAIHETLRKCDIGHIRGTRALGVSEAIAFCEEDGLACAVVKPLQSAGSRGLFLCVDLNEVRHAASTLLNSVDIF